MLSFEELKTLVSIDTTQLDVCCAEQPGLFMEANELVAEYKTQVEVAELNLDRIKSLVGLKYRTGELESKAGKTEATIQSLVNQYPDVQQAENELIKLKKEYFKCTGIVAAYDHRRSMLTNSVTLHSTGYFQCGDIKPRHQKINFEETEKEIIKQRGLKNGR
jgi:hypothetical protein